MLFAHRLPGSCRLSCDAVIVSPAWGDSIQNCPAGGGNVKRIRYRGSCVAQTQTSDYSLVWADEFNKDGRPDPNNWVYEYGFERNERLRWYQPDNAVCRDGMLVIEARRITVSAGDHSIPRTISLGGQGAPGQRPRSRTDVATA